jgi:hypothetical protein
VREELELSIVSRIEGGLRGTLLRRKDTDKDDGVMTYS